MALRKMLLDEATSEPLSKFGSNGSVSWWGVKPLSKSEKKEIIKLIKSNRISDEFIRSYREFVHQEKVMMDLRFHSSDKRQLSFKEIKNNFTNDSKKERLLGRLGFIRDNLLGEYSKYKYLSPKALKRKLSRQKLEKRLKLINDCYDGLSIYEDEYTTSLLNKDILVDSQFSNVIEYFAVLQSKIEPVKLGLEFYHNMIMNCYTPKEAIRCLAKETQSNGYLYSRVLEQVSRVRVNNYNHGFFAESSIKEDLKDLALENEVINSDKKLTEVVSEKFADPLMGINLEEVEFEDEETISFANNVWNTNLSFTRNSDGEKVLNDSEEGENEEDKSN